MIARIATLALTAGALAAAPAAAQHGYGGHGNDHGSDIVETAQAAGSFQTLVTALQEAGLVETLQQPGPFTVFAPTDEAFAKLPEGALQSLLANPERLREVLLYHVVPGRVTAEQVVHLDGAETVAGAELPIQVMHGRVHVGGATVVDADVAASNGVIHVIDTVLMPPMGRPAR